VSNVSHGKTPPPTNVKIISCQNQLLLTLGSTLNQTHHERRKLLLMFGLQARIKFDTKALSNSILFDGCVHTVADLVQPDRLSSGNYNRNHDEQEIRALIARWSKAVR